jgi:FKBP-type peptidyl-prolyl cis-trans isomerase (trigger factor)
MKTIVEKLNKIKRRLAVEVGKNKLAQDKKDIYKEIAKDIKVPGFRPGTAPLEVVEKQHAAALREQFLQKMLPQYYSQALVSEKLEPVSRPKVYDISFTDDKLSFKAEFDIKPEIEVKDTDYKGVKLKNRPVEVKAVEVEKLITQLKENVKKLINKDYDDQKLANWAGYASISELKDAIKAELYVNKARQRKGEIENELVDKLIKQIKVEVSPMLVEQHQQRLLQQELQGLKMRGLKEEDIDKYKKDITKRLNPIAEKQVKMYYILEAIAKKEGLKLEQQNLSEAVIGYILSFANYS